MASVRVDSLKTEPDAFLPTKKPVDRDLNNVLRKYLGGHKTQPSPPKYEKTKKIKSVQREVPLKRLNKTINQETQMSKNQSTYTFNNCSQKMINIEANNKLSTDYLIVKPSMPSDKMQTLLGSPTRRSEGTLVI